ncbi:GIY-YIG nuclease family protein [Cyclobacterium xiamenense]|uniref:GIY-YIG nuclease family protein n=1 Tax=Cyclobacterium xiamenense TaxID=1297121 RepID=UPI0035D016E7
MLYSPCLNRLAVGQTQDLESRLQRHNSGRNKSTKAGIPWVLIHLEKVADRLAAVAKEKQIKNMGSRRDLQRIDTSDRPDDSGSVS